MSWKLYEGDCLEVMPTLPDDTFDLIILDPPYNIGKDTWDKFPSHDEYLIFIEKVLKESERVLKDNGSLYLWHNQFPVLSDFQWLIKEKTDLIFKQLITWNKRFEGASNKGFLDGYVELTGLRNFQKMAEYCLFYTFQDETGLNQVLKQDGFYNLMDYFKQEREKLGWNYNECDEFLGIKASYCYWDKPTTHPYRIPEEKHYLKLQSTGFFKREYEDLRREYEDLRREYEDLRYTFNNQKTHHSIWNYKIPKKIGHITPKPVKLSENIIKHSSNINDTILIPFAGSGSEMIASTNLNRNVIGIEQNPQYCQIIKDRLSELNIEEQPHEGQKVLTEF
jgi:site-specific DNA-methyltransferase (adenine-specific)